MAEVRNDPVSQFTFMAPPPLVIDTAALQAYTRATFFSLTMPAGHQSQGTIRVVMIDLIIRGLARTAFY
jgi:hypothetical protein